MVFYVRWIYRHSSPNPTLVASDSGGIRRLVVGKINLTWKTIQNAHNPTGKNIGYVLHIRCIQVIINMHVQFPSDLVKIKEPCTMFS